MIELLGAIAGVGALAYMAFIGQKTLREWLTERSKANQSDNSPNAPDKILHNLPNPEYGQFVGRENELNDLMRLLRPYPYSQHSVITIDGVGGVGKSALALEVAHRLLRRETDDNNELFDAIVWTSAKESVLTAEGIQAKKYAFRTLQDIFNTIATTLEREDINKAEGTQRSNTVRKALTMQRTLLIIDNLETVDDEAVLEFLRDLPAPTKAIVTTRHRIDVSYPIRLKGMSLTDATVFVQKECKKKSVSLENDKIVKLYERTGGIPLALVWSIAKMGLGYSFDSVIKDLGKPSGDIAKFCFEKAVSVIRESEAYNLLLALGLFASSASREALGEMTETNQRPLDRDESLVILERLSLVNKYGDRFSFLPLTKSYVIGELARNRPFENMLGRRWINYLKIICGDPEQAYFWRWKNYEFIEDGPNLLSAIDYAYEHGTADDVFILTFGANEYLEIVGQWHDEFELAKRGLSLAQTSGNPRMAARFLGDMGWIIQQWGKYEEAQSQFDQASQIFHSLGDQEGICKSLVWYSVIQRKRGNFEASEKLCIEALEMADKLNLEHLRIDAKSEYGKLLRDTNRLDEAEECFTYVKNWGESLVAGTPYNESIPAGSWGHLAAIALKRRKYELAHDLCLRSLAFFDKKGSKGYVATLKYRMALADYALGRKEQALKNACEALYWYKRIGMMPDVAIVEPFVAKLGRC